MACCAAALASAVVLATQAPGPAAPRTASAWELELEVGGQVLGGHTTYHIDIQDGAASGASELEFPLGGVLLGVRAQAGIRPSSGRRWVFQVAGLGTAGVTGTMRDSDWLNDVADVQMVGQAHPGKDIYSESSTGLTAWILDARAGLEMDATPAVAVGPIVGLRYERLDYEVRDVRQVGYGPYGPSFTGAVDGHVLDYRVSYRIVYAGLHAALARGRFTGTADAWGSPFVAAEDRDDHILRQRLAATSATGWAAAVSLGGRFALTGRDALGAQLSFMRIRATGTQHQSFYGGAGAGLAGDVSAILSSAQTALSLAYVRSW